MPTKANRHGNQQPYVPAGNGDESGEYRDSNYGGNSTETEKGSSISTKPIEKTKKEPIKSSYNGKGNQNLQEQLKQRMGKSSNYAYVVDQIKDADDEYSGMIADYYRDYEDTQLKFGKNLSSKYQVRITTSYLRGTVTIDRSVAIGQGLFTDTDFYSKGGVFFHESGHALDNTYMQDMKRGNWSCDFISEKHGVALKDMISKEIRENINEESYNKLVEEIKQETEKAKATLWNENKQKELDDVKSQLDSNFKVLSADSNYQKLKNEMNNLQLDVADLREKWYQASNSNELWQQYRSKREEYANKQQELNDYQDDFYKQHFPNHFTLRERKSNLEDEKYNLHNKARGPVCKKYGDLADMVNGTLYRELPGVPMGHDLSYWNSSNRGKEAFAEIMSAKATNPESFEILKKYIPKTIEIFDEIIGKIKSKEK